MDRLENISAKPLDPNELSWEEVRELGLEPQPSGNVPDGDNDVDA
ncbi:MULTISPECIES: hypothetical protein [Burkholderia cepacia complex]|nr:MULTISPECIES: hypothetical protein [Burkholderia cepacia complex]